MRQRLLRLVVLMVLSACEQQQDLGHGAEAPCRPGLTRCDRRCVDTFSDPAHCGGCGLACPAGKLCQSGTCVSGCSQPYSACGGACVILYQDDLHCGACEKMCPGEQHCDNAVCISCAAGTVPCLVSSARSWRCVSVATDGQNCGGCGIVCTSGQRCGGGSCR